MFPKKKTAIFLLVLFSIILSQTPLTKDILCNTNWEGHWEFRQNGYYCRLLSGIDSYMAVGKYSIRDGKLYMSDPIESSEDDPFSEVKNFQVTTPFKIEYEAELITDKNAFRSSCYLIVSNKNHTNWLPEFVDKKESYIPKGRLISLSNCVAITLSDMSRYAISAKTTSNLSLRATPSANGKRLPWYTIEEINDTDNESVYKYEALSLCKLSYLKKQTEDLKLTNLAYIPESTSIRAIARTYYKDTINGVSDYWYYVDADNSGYQINGEGWVWGEFLSIEK